MEKLNKLDLLKDFDKLEELLQAASFEELSVEDQHWIKTRVGEEAFTAYQKGLKLGKNILDTNQSPMPAVMPKALQLSLQGQKAWYLKVWDKGIAMANSPIPAYVAFGMLCVVGWMRPEGEKVVEQVMQTQIVRDTIVEQQVLRDTIMDQQIIYRNRVKIEKEVIYVPKIDTVYQTMPIAEQVVEEKTINRVELHPSDIEEILQDSLNNLPPIASRSNKNLMKLLVQIN